MCEVPGSGLARSRSWRELAPSLLPSRVSSLEPGLGCVPCETGCTPGLGWVLGTSVSTARFPSTGSTTARGAGLPAPIPPSGGLFSTPSGMAPWPLCQPANLGEELFGVSLESVFGARAGPRLPLEVRAEAVHSVN